MINLLFYFVFFWTPKSHLAGSCLFGRKESYRIISLEGKRIVSLKHESATLAAGQWKVQFHPLPGGFLKPF